MAAFTKPASSISDMAEGEGATFAEVSAPTRTELGLSVAVGGAMFPEAAADADVDAGTEETEDVVLKFLDLSSSIPSPSPDDEL